MQNLPFYIGTLVVLATIFSAAMFIKATRWNKSVLLILGIWLALQAAIASTGFYTNTAGIPPRFTLTIIPALVAILLLFVSGKGRKFLDSLDLDSLTLSHFVRVPVEFVLLLLFMHGAVPQAMTFEGSNLDILSGITAPIIWYLTRHTNNRKMLLGWNFLCLGLLLNIVITAVIAAPFEFQQIAFDQPNIAVLYFPFVWLPACIVPLVLLSHLAAIRQLMREAAMKLVSKRNKVTDAAFKKVLE